MLAQQAAPNLHSLFLAATSTLLAATAAVAVVIRITSALFASFIIRDIQHVPFGRVSGLDLLHFASLSSTAYTQYTDIGYAAAAHGHGHGADENIQKKKPELTRCTFFPPLLLCENLFQDLMHTNFFHKTAHALRAMIITLGTSSTQHGKHTKHLLFAVKRNSSLFSLNYFHLSISVWLFSNLLFTFASFLYSSRPVSIEMYFCMCRRGLSIYPLRAYSGVSSSSTEPSEGIMGRKLGFCPAMEVRHSEKPNSCLSRTGLRRKIMHHRTISVQLLADWA